MSVCTNMQLQVVASSCFHLPSSQVSGEEKAVERLHEFSLVSAFSFKKRKKVYIYHSSLQIYKKPHLPPKSKAINRVLALKMQNYVQYAGWSCIERKKRLLFLIACCLQLGVFICAHRLQRQIIIQQTSTETLLLYLCIIHSELW